MQSLSEGVWQLAPPGGIFGETLVQNLFPGVSAGARRALVNRALQAGEVLSLRRGVYMLAKKFMRGSVPADPFYITQYLYPPCYVSMESALRYHGLIPEFVPMVTCGSSRRSRDFDTPAGYYSFRKITCSPLRVGVRSEELASGELALVASPLKALADILYLRRGVNWKKDGLTFLTESLRVDWEAFRLLPHSDAEAVLSSFRNHRVCEYLDELLQELREER